MLRHETDHPHERGDIGVCRAFLLLRHLCVDLSRWAANPYHQLFDHFLRFTMVVASSRICRKLERLRNFDLTRTIADRNRLMFHRNRGG